MALKSTIYKATLGISDLDRSYYAEHALTLARHPSETDERLMVRVLAFALYADERLEFGRGISSDDEPALWRREYSGEIALWIEVGLPDERLLRRAAGRARQVVVFAYGGRSMDAWWEREAAACARIDHLTVFALDETLCNSLTGLANRSMELQCTIQERQIWFSEGERTVQIEPRVLKAGKGG